MINFCQFAISGYVDKVLTKPYNEIKLVIPVDQARPNADVPEEIFMITGDIHMYTLGIDIGSTTSKCAILKDGKDLIATSLVVGGMGTPGPDEAVRQVFEKSGLKREDMAMTIATGYGRTRYKGSDMDMSELSCHAMGAHHVFPTVRTVIDIGGQDAKLISLDERGRMKDFLMNDKCAAGTGRFLDVMANILQLDVNDLGKLAAQADKPAAISSTCTVFAESEVISQLANGVTTPNLVAGICASVSSRVAALAKRIGPTPDICMSGGVAQNGGVLSCMEKELGTKILVSPMAQLFGALGAAYFAYEKAPK